MFEEVSVGVDYLPEKFITNNLKINVLGENNDKILQKIVDYVEDYKFGIVSSPSKNKIYEKINNKVYSRYSKLLERKYLIKDKETFLILDTVSLTENTLKDIKKTLDNNDILVVFSNEKYKQNCIDFDYTFITSECYNTILYTYDNHPKKYLFSDFRETTQEILKSGEIPVINSSGEIKIFTV